MIIPFIVGITILATVGAVGIWVCLEFCKACSERRRVPAGAAADGAMSLPDSPGPRGGPLS